MKTLYFKEEKINDAYKKLLEEIKKDTDNDDYTPKNYSFNLDSFDEEENQKK